MVVVRSDTVPRHRARARKLIEQHTKNTRQPRDDLGNPTAYRPGAGPGNGT